MKPYTGQLYILIGFFLVLLGFIFPLLMVLHELKSTFFLNFFSYAASITGLLLGIIGAAFIVREQRRKY